jgi:hypothetical protein
MSSDGITFRLVTPIQKDFGAEVYSLGSKTYFFDKCGHKVILGETYLNTNNPMKPHFVAILVVISSTAFAQTKTLGVGVATPNPNAALHLESPTLNQGFIMPRLTTIQRSAMSLGSVDDGLMTYDTNLKKIFIWDGGLWQPATGLNFPFNGFDGNASTTFAITNTGAGIAAGFFNSGTGPVATFSTVDPANASHTVSVTTAGPGFGLYVQNTNNTGNAVFGQVVNPSSNGSAFTGITNGIGPVMYMRHAGTTTGSILDLAYLDANNTGTAILGNHVGLGKVAEFNITNNVNFDNVLEATSLGQGTSGYFRTSNALSIAPTVRATTNGTGGAGYFDITNASSNAPAFLTSTNGTGRALMATSSGPARAATFSITNAGSTAPVVEILNSGSGPAISAVGSIQATSFSGDGSALTNLPSSGWGLTGTLGTNAATNFIGTTDGQHLVLKSNNVEGIRILPSGQVGIGSVPAAAKLDVVSTTSTLGIHGSINTPSGVQNKGVWGNAEGSSTQNIGVFGSANIAGSNGAIGVYGEGVGTGSANATGLYGVTNTFTSTTGTTYGLYASAINGAINWAGFFDSGNVHITNSLSVGSAGSFGTVGQVLTSQGGSTSPIWANSSGWSLSGNTGSGSEFIGTTNDQPLRFRVNNQSAGQVGNSTSANTFLGYESGLNHTSTQTTAVGFRALFSNSTGAGNTAVGYQGLQTNTTGTNNTAIGYNADVTSSNLTNATAIGANAQVGTNNTIVLGATGTYVAVGGSVPQAMLSVSHSGAAEPAAIFGITNAGNIDAALAVTTIGAGHAVEFSNLNAGNANAVLSIANSGSGPAVLASGYISASQYTASSNSSSANVDIIQGGTGGAGTFQIANAVNSTAALLATTNGTGSGIVVNVTNGGNNQPGVEINHGGNAIALSMNGGTLKYSTATIGASGSITVKAGVYRIAVTGNFTLPSAIDGETCLVFNDSGAPIGGDLSSVGSGTIRQFVFIFGAWRIVN